MRILTVETTINSNTDDLLSFNEAFKAASKISIRTGEQVTIRFAEAMNVLLTDTLKVKTGADIAIDGRIQGGGNSIGTSDVNFLGNGRQIFDTYTMISVASGATLELIDVSLTDNLVAGGSGRNGRSGDDGLNGNDGEGEDVPGSPGNGGLSVATNGRDGGDAAGGIENRGTLVLDRVNMTHLFAYGGNGGAAGRGGNGGDGGDGSGDGVGGSGGPGGSGLGSGGDGGDAAAGVLNYGDLTLIDTWFQACVAAAGNGGTSGSGGRGGNGGNGGTVGGAGGNGGLGGGTGGSGGDAASTVLNRGSMTVIGGWADGSNAIQAGGNGGAAGLGGFGGNGGRGSELDGGDGIGGASGGPGASGTSGEVLGYGGGFVNDTVFLRQSVYEVDEFGGAGAGGNLIEIRLVRLGSVLGAASATVSLAGLGGADGGTIQGGLFTDRLVNFAAGQASASLFIFTRSDAAETADQTYRFTITGATGTVLGGNLTADVVVTNSDIVGTASPDLLEGTRRPEVILGGNGNDTLLGDAGNDQLDGQGGIDWADYAAAEAGKNGRGMTIDLFAFSAKGKGVGNDAVFNIENFILSRFDDRATGDFNGNTLLGGRGNDRLDGNFGADSLSGGAGQDKVTGGIGNDTLDGGTGRDTLTGNEGADVFLFSSGPAGDLAKNRDVITDFDAALDSIHLRRTGDGPFDALDFGALDGSAFRIGTQATRAAHRIIYDDATGQLLYDADGKGGAAAVLFAVLDGAPALSATDFTVI